VDRLELDKVNKIIADIAVATLSNLISEASIEAGYNERLVIGKKSYAKVKEIRKNKEDELRGGNEKAQAISEVRN